MLILALFMVLFSNHMEERLRDGKSVLRVDCAMTIPPGMQYEKDDEVLPDEKTSLVPHGQVRQLWYHYNELYCLYLQEPPTRSGVN